MTPDKTYKCNYCNYKCKRKYCWMQHLLTIKHIKNEKENEKEEQFKEKKNKDNIICELVKQNGQMIELLKQNQNIPPSKITINNTFNIHLFLNETCKNAMNFNEFIKSINIDLNDLISMGKLGYVNGISTIINTNLNSLNVLERPLHCTDIKREILYVKDNNMWSKDVNKIKLKNAIKQISNKNILLIQKYKQMFPEYNNFSSDTSLQYDKILVEALGGNNSKTNYEKKIIKKISNFVAIKKTQ